MRIEVTIEGSPSLFFPVDKDEITLGSSRSCDISLPVVGVSRKHVVITREGENIFITDLGSTNGTFINEERLKPNDKTPLLAFFRVTIGDRIWISLVQDEQTGVFQRPSLSNDPSAKKSDEKKKNEPETTVLKVDSSRTKQTYSSQKTSSGQNMGTLMGLLILAGAIYWFFTYQTEEEHISYDSPTPAIEPRRPEPKIVTHDINLIHPKELVSKTQLQDLLKDIKCTLDVEKYLCEIFQNRINGQFGAVQVGTNLNLLIDGTPFFREAEEIMLKRKSLSDLTETERAEFKINSERVALALFLLEVPTYFAFEKLEGVKLNIAFFTPVSENTDHEVRFVAAFLPKSLKTAISEFKPTSQKDLKKRGVGTIMHITNYYTHL